MSLRWATGTALIVTFLTSGCAGHGDRWKVSGNSSRVVIYFHGANATGDPLSGPPADLMARLHKQGWTLLGANADGNAYGNPASVRDYESLIRSVHAKTVVGIAESMGALPAMQMVRAGLLKNLWLVSPTLNLTTLLQSEDFGDQIRAAWHGNPPATASPVNWHQPLPAGVRITIAADPHDPTVPAAKNAELFAQEHHLTVISCAGGHVAPSCFAKVHVTAQ